MRKKNWVKYGIGIFFAGAAMIALMGLATMWLWNWLVPELFSGSTITFFQAIGLIALGKLLTGFMGMGRHGWGKHSNGWNHKKEMYWKEKMEAKMSSMTEEEREKFKRYYYDRCGWKTKRDEAVEDKTQAQQ